MPNNKLTDTRGILNFRPTIDFVEPPEIEGPAAVPVIPTQAAATNPVIASNVAQTQTVINQYNSLQNLCDLAQVQIDSAASNLSICLDTTQSPQALASLKKLFGSQYTCISYGQYLQCLAVVSAAGSDTAPQITSDAVTAASGNPYNTNLGGYTTTPGGLANPYESPIKPINAANFQNEQIEALIELILIKLAEASNPELAELFELLYPLLKSKFKSL